MLISYFVKGKLGRGGRGRVEILSTTQGHEVLVFSFGCGRVAGRRGEGGFQGYVRSHLTFFFFFF